MPHLAPHIIRWFLRTFGYGGIALPPPLIRHELADWAQYERKSALGFYTSYLWGLVRHGYRNRPMEIEAQDAKIACRSNCI